MIALPRYRHLDFRDARTHKEEELVILVVGCPTVANDEKDHVDGKSCVNGI